MENKDMRDNQRWGEKRSTGALNLVKKLIEKAGKERQVKRNDD